MTENELKGNWTGDNTSRCTECGTTGNDGIVTGTPLSLITINISSTKDPFIPVARAGVCMKCHKRYQIKLLPMASKMGVSLANVEKCMIATKNATAYKITELQSGRMENVKFSKTLNAIFNKQLKSIPTNIDYDPNKTVEQETIEEVPF